MRPAAPAVLVLGALLLAGCGSTGDDDTASSPSPTSTSTRSATPSSTPSSTPAPTTPQAGETSLTVVLDADGTTTSYSLTCDPPAGDVPDPAAACAGVAAADPSVFDPIPADALCAQQFDGPEVARVTGTLDGDPVDATFSRTDGCRIIRWNALAALLQPGR